MIDLHDKRLYVRPVPVRFLERDKTQFTTLLSDITSRTELTTVDSVRQLEMDSYGKLPGPYRMLSNAFRQVCKTTAIGSRQLLLDISGVYRGPEDDASEYSFELAVRTYNSLVAVRAARFEGRATLVRDTRMHLVDGVLGPKATFLENEEIFMQAEALMPVVARPVRFHSAILTGRRMVVRYITEEPLCILPGKREPDRYYGGLHFSNNSITGESIRAGVVISRQRDLSTACGGFSSVGTVRHTGKGFRKNLTRMFRNAVLRFDKLDNLPMLLETLRRKPLGFTGEKKQAESRTEDIVRVLHRTQIPKMVCRKIVASAMHFGSENYNDQIPDFFSQADVRTRTEFDLYIAATRVAQDLSVQLQEATEQLAYKLLTGRFSFQ